MIKLLFTEKKKSLESNNNTSTLHFESWIFSMIDNFPSLKENFRATQLYIIVSNPSKHAK